MSEFFIRRPVLAVVLALLLMLAGLLALGRLPVAQYPDVAPVQIAVMGTWNGASATATDQGVVQPVEAQMKGLDGLVRIESSSSTGGDFEVVLTFLPGTSPQMAQTEVRNRLSEAESGLPEALRRSGISVEQVAENAFLTVAFHDASGIMTAVGVNDFVAAHVLRPLGRVDGVGRARLYGTESAMRIWLDPERMHARGLIPADVIGAVEAQGALITLDRTGGAPAAGEELTRPFSARGLLETPEEFGRILLRTDASGGIIRLSDVARVELGAEYFQGDSTFNGRPAAVVSLQLAAGANLLRTSAAVKELLERMAPSMPPGLGYALADDSAPTVAQSVRAVVRTLLEGALLVVAVMLAFLGSWRATLIPAVTIPVVLAGVLAVLLATGCTLNLITLFAMVLAVGLLVDDAVIVVENTERLMQDEGLDARRAAVRSMRQITGALVGVTAVLCAVFAPELGATGTSGIIGRQFAVTLIAAMGLSALVALILSPTLCAGFLRPVPASGDAGTRNPSLAGRLLASTEGACRGMIRRLLRIPAGGIVAAGLLGTGCILLHQAMPSSFLPEEDLGVINIDVTLPQEATLGRTRGVLAGIEAHLFENEREAVQGVTGISGWGMTGSGENQAMMIVQLQDWKDRDARHSAAAVTERLQEAFSGMPEAEVFVSTPPAIMELGATSGFEAELVDLGGLGPDALEAAAERVIRSSADEPLLGELRRTTQERGGTWRLSIDRERAGVLGVDAAAFNDMISAYWSGTEAGRFSDGGTVKNVRVQAEPDARRGPQDFGRYWMRTASGGMTPASDFCRMEEAFEPRQLTRLQGAPSVRLSGEAAGPGGLGGAMAALERIAAKEAPGFALVWKGLAEESREAGQGAFGRLALSLLVVFLCLSALYESWSVPAAVLLAAPAGLFGMFAGAFAAGLADDLYFQIALLVVTGLSAKNSILIVEFARQAMQNGEDAEKAALEAVRLRLRPILMTSACFMLGVLPLMFGTGPGAGAQFAVGTAVFSGMLGSTAIGIVLTPVLFVEVVRWRALLGRLAGRRREK